MKPKKASFGDPDFDAGWIVRQARQAQDQIGQQINARLTALYGDRFLVTVLFTRTSSDDMDSWNLRERKRRYDESVATFSFGDVKSIFAWCAYHQKKRRRSK